jgi:RNA polymerase sigma factor (TIGR02999 family)
MTDTDNITELLHELNAGHRDVLSILLPKIRGELRRIANLYFSKERAAHNFDLSDLVQETTFRMLIPGKGHYNDREHFFAVAALNVRQRLTDYGRARCAQKRGSGNWTAVEPDEGLPASPEHWTEFFDVNDALQRLQALNEQQSRIVEYRVFGGMTVEEVAKELGISDYTVKRDWGVAAAFLRRELRAYGDARAVGQD